MQICNTFYLINEKHSEGICETGNEPDEPKKRKKNIWKQKKMYFGLDANSLNPFG